MDYAKKKHSSGRGYIIKVLLAFWMIVLGSFCGRAMALSWSSPQAVAGPSGSINYQAIAVDTSGNWHVVYEDASYGDPSTYYIKYVSSTGANGIVAQAISSGGYGEYLEAPGIDVDLNGHVHVIYGHYSYDNDEYSIMYKNNSSGSWSSPETVAGPSGSINHQAIAVDTSGNWHVVYEDASYGDPSTYYIKYVSSTGANGIVAQAISSGGYGEYLEAPGIDVDLNGHVHVIYGYYSYDNDEYSIMYTTTEPEAVTVIVHGYQPDGMVPGWTYDMRNAILDRTAETCPRMVVIVFDWADASNDGIPPRFTGDASASDVLRREAQRLARQLINSHLVTAGPGCHLHLIGHSRGGSLVSYAASLLNSHFGRCVVNHMTILEGIDENSSLCWGWESTDPAICGNNADWTDNYYQTTDWVCHGQSRPDADLNEEWPVGHVGFAEAYTDTIVHTLQWMGYWWSLGGGGWDDPTKPHGRAFCSQSGTKTVINGDYETQDLLGWSTLLGTPSVVPHGADNYVCQMEEQSSVAIAQTIMTPAHARFLLFDFAFTNQGDGDSLTVTLGGTTIFTFVGTDFQSSDLVSSGLIGISAFAGQTSLELVFMLNSVGEPGATVLLDNIKVITAGDSDADADVDLSDFSILAAHWFHDSCGAPDWCDGTDVAPEIPDGLVNELDLAVMVAHWLEGTTP